MSSSALGVVSGLADYAFSLSLERFELACSLGFVHCQIGHNPPYIEFCETVQARLISVPSNSMSKPTSRVLAVLELLQASSRPVPGSEIALRMGVDGRTVRRYITHLTELGVPIEALRGRDGGYLLSVGHRLPPMMFSADEALALAVGLRAAKELGLHGITPAVASTQAKLSRVMPQALRQRLAAIERMVSLGLQRHGGTTGDAAVLPMLSMAAYMQQRVRLSYKNAAGEASDREADIYGLAYRGGRWYAAGHCHLRGELRAFRLDRVVFAEAIPKTFARPDGFSVQEYLAQSIATLPRLYSIRIELDASPTDARNAFPPELGVLTESEHGIRLQMQADDLDWVARLLAGVPFGFRIIQPTALRRAAAAHVARLRAAVTTSGGIGAAD